MILFHWCRKINIYILKTLSFRVGGGQDKLAWTAYPPGVKIIRVGGKISREILPPGGQAVQGGKINCYTGINSYAKFEENGSKTTQVRERKRTKCNF